MYDSWISVVGVAVGISLVIWIFSDVQFRFIFLIWTLLFLMSNILLVSFVRLIVFTYNLLLCSLSTIYILLSLFSLLLKAWLSFLKVSTLNKTTCLEWKQLFVLFNKDFISKPHMIRCCCQFHLSSACVAASKNIFYSEDKYLTTSGVSCPKQVQILRLLLSKIKNLKL